ncbi:MAG: phenylalanine--tRNA ligase subunit alpha, partial [Clostridia bacterium]|nr:phenylalanine--tRNA ligase subunit alpha [Clostridia bacterium]
MKAQLDNISVAAAQEIASASDKASLETVRIKYLGKKGALTAILRGMGALTPEERPVIGAYANTVRANIEALLEEKGASLASAELKN